MRAEGKQQDSYFTRENQGKRQLGRAQLSSKETSKNAKGPTFNWIRLEEYMSPELCQKQQSYQIIICGSQQLDVMLEADNLTESGKETVQESPVNTTDVAGCHPSITKTEE